MTRFIFVLIIGLTIFSCQQGDYYARESVLLPSAELAIDISTDARRVYDREVRATIFVSPRVEKGSFDYWIPSTLSEATEELRKMLSDEVYLAIMNRYIEDIAPTNEELLQISGDIKWDLSNYLFEIWQLDSSVLGRNLYCLGMFEENLAPFFILAASKYAEDKGLKLKTIYQNDSRKLKSLSKKCLK